MKITADLFNAYLDCPTKSWLRGRGETSSGNLYSHWEASQEQVYRREGFNRLLRDIPSADHVIAPTKLLNCRPPKWRMVLDVSVQVFSTESCLLESRIDALERVSSEGSSKRAREMRFVPIRFVFANKVTKKERLLLGFDALVLSQALKSEVREGRIIHGDQYTARKIVATALADETQKLILRLEALLASHSPPDLVLNRHCAKCEFQGRCRKQAIEKDELTLLAGMTEKRLAWLPLKSSTSSRKEVIETSKAYSRSGGAALCARRCPQHLQGPSAGRPRLPREFRVLVRSRR